MRDRHTPGVPSNGTDTDVYCDIAQLYEGRPVMMLRQLQFPLAAIRHLLADDPADAAVRIASHWRDTEAAHDARRDLADYLVNRLSGMRSVRYGVANKRDVRANLLCLKRYVDEQGLWASPSRSIEFRRERLAADEVRPTAPVTIR